MNADDSSNVHDVVTAKYEPEQDRSVSGVVLEAIATYKDEDLTANHCSLYDDIDPDALDNIFRDDPQPNTVVEFDTDDVRVMLWGNGGVEIRVTGLPTLSNQAE
jgi:hypothetical protein